MTSFIKKYDHFTIVRDQITKMMPLFLSQKKTNWNNFIEKLSHEKSIYFTDILKATAKDLQLNFGFKILMGALLLHQMLI